MACAVQAPSPPHLEQLVAWIAPAAHIKMSLHRIIVSPVHMGHAHRYKDSRSVKRARKDPSALRWDNHSVSPALQTPSPTRAIHLHAWHVHPGDSPVTKTCPYVNRVPRDRMHPPPVRHHVWPAPSDSIMMAKRPPAVQPVHLAHSPTQLDRLILLFRMCSWNRQPVVWLWFM